MTVSFIGGVLVGDSPAQARRLDGRRHVRVHYAAIAPRVARQVVAVPVDDAEVVKAGDVLVLLDPRDYETTLKAAEAQIERDQARSGDIGATIDRQPALIEQAAADVDAARARLAFAEADARRYGALATTGAGTGQQRQQADTTLKATQAALRGALAQLDANRRQLDVLRKQKSTSEASIKADQARLEQTRWKIQRLDYTSHPSPPIPERTRSLVAQHPPSPRRFDQARQSYCRTGSTAERHWAEPRPSRDPTLFRPHYEQPVVKICGLNHRPRASGRHEVTPANLSVPTPGWWRRQISRSGR